MLPAVSPASVPALAGAATSLSAPLPTAVITGDWQVHVTCPGSPEVTLPVPQATRIQIKDERYDTLKVFDEKAALWGRGTRLKGFVTFETSVPDMLIVDSLRLKTGPGEATALRAGTDYQLEPRWANAGLLPGSTLTGPFWADYEMGRGRIDSIVRETGGKIVLRQGIPDNATPHPPTLANGERRLFNLWVRGRLERLTDNDIYAVAETTFPEPAGPAPAQKQLPKTWAKLTAKSGAKLSILAWGDSVTAGGQTSDVAHRYQEQFLTRLRQRFPNTEINLTTVAWPGRNSGTFLAEPPGSEHNFQEKVLNAHPDLIVMEFVNDSSLKSAQLEERYGGLLARFREIGAEWVILTPHFVWGEWMGTGTAKVDHDPRPYVAALHAFVAHHADSPGLALADASHRWEHLVKEGIPYQTLLCNSLNHPDDRGHALFADALMELFPKP